MPDQTSAQEYDVRIELIDNEDDIITSFDCACEAFGHQINDGIWSAIYPGWDTPEGRACGAARRVKTWRGITTNNQGQLNALFLKATVPDPQQPGGEGRVIAGLANWGQYSVVDGYGDAPSDDLGKGTDLETLYPGNEREQRYAYQVYRSLMKQRMEVVKEKATADPPAIFALDLCAVDPAFQRRGIAGKLVQWGLDEAKRRGLEATTEASVMGRHVYARLGFKPQLPEIQYEVDEEFLERERPSNLFMRTGDN
ncbi:uncharacterized protein BCR38DRAFT_416921 [Pseudomassariella vexata]|uniref:N-acetyltransferase domain-containing protein n=1 Tax=Pseudomassariella vexata TaxID=1141098 RepID=A0A1Y2EJJ0_9PEZI|nr:uncharacterized protein BCR38DRAFT_416921 [Pseudomassariella vexata]ORY71474.1 hypothetical protein BCR38DRAFT_416921 [Pseudomassariella vexata]